MRGPGPIERRWRSQLYYKVFGVWPQGVVTERLASIWFDDSNVRAILDEVHSAHESTHEG